MMHKKAMVLNFLLGLILAIVIIFVFFKFMSGILGNVLSQTDKSFSELKSAIDYVSKTPGATRPITVSIDRGKALMVFEKNSDAIYLESETKLCATADLYLKPNICGIGSSCVCLCKEFEDDKTSNVPEMYARSGFKLNPKTVVHKCKQPVCQKLNDVDVKGFCKVQKGDKSYNKCIGGFIVEKSTSSSGIQIGTRELCVDMPKQRTVYVQNYNAIVGLCEQKDKDTNSCFTKEYIEDIKPKEILATLKGVINSCNTFARGSNCGCYYFDLKNLLEYDIKIDAVKTTFSIEKDNKVFDSFDIASKFCEYDIFSKATRMSNIATISKDVPKDYVFDAAGKEVIAFVKTDEGICIASHPADNTKWTKRDNGDFLNNDNIVLNGCTFSAFP